MRYETTKLAWRCKPGQKLFLAVNHTGIHDAHHDALCVQVVFSFAEYDDICRRLQSRHLQPSLLGSSALIPYATLGSLR